MPRMSYFGSWSAARRGTGNRSAGTRMAGDESMEKGVHVNSHLSAFVRVFFEGGENF